MLFDTIYQMMKIKTIMMKNIPLFKKVIDVFGYNNQREMMVEECSELIQSIQKYKSEFGEFRVLEPNAKQKKVYYNYIEELVDVEIILNQLKCTIDEKIYYKHFNNAPTDIKSVKLYFPKGQREQMIYECSKLIQAIQKVKREESKYNFIHNLANFIHNLAKDPNYFLYRNGKESKKVIETFIQGLVNIEIILIELKKIVDKKLFSQHYNFKITRLKNRLNAKEKENKIKKLGTPKSKNWDDPLNQPIKKRNYGK